MAGKRVGIGRAPAASAGSWTLGFSLGAAGAAAALNAAAWGWLLLGFLGPAAAGRLVVDAAALLGAGLGWWLAWRRAFGDLEHDLGGRPRKAQRDRRQPPADEVEVSRSRGLAAFGLASLAGSLLLLPTALGRPAALAAVQGWMRLHLLPGWLDALVRMVVALAAVCPVTILFAFGAGAAAREGQGLAHGSQGPARKGTRGRPGVRLEVVAGIGSGAVLGLAAAAALHSLAVPAATWVLLAALLGLVGAGAAIAAGPRLGAKPTDGGRWETSGRDPQGRSPEGSAKKGIGDNSLLRTGRRKQDQSHRVAGLAFITGLVLAVYLYSGEGLVTRATAQTPVPFAASAALGVVVLCVGWFLAAPGGDRARRAPNIHAGLLVAGCTGLAAAAILGWVGLRAADTGEPARGYGLLLRGLAWLPLLVAGRVLGRSVREGAGAALRAAGPALAGVGVGGGVNGLLLVPALGAEVGAVGVMVLAVVVGAVLAAREPERSATARIIAVTAAVLVTALVLTLIRAGGLFRHRSRTPGTPSWVRTATSVLGETTWRGPGEVRLNGLPLPGAQEGGVVAAWRGAVPARAGSAPERLLVVLGGDERLLAALAAATVAGPREANSQRAGWNGGTGVRLVVGIETIPGVCADGETRQAASLLGRLRGLWGHSRARTQVARPGLPEHLATTEVIYDLVVVDARSPDPGDLARLACAETLGLLAARLSDEGRAWYWLDLHRTSRDGMRALVAAGLHTGLQVGVWTWEGRDAMVAGAPETALAALVLSRGRFEAGAEAAERPSLADASDPFDFPRRLRVVEAARWGELAQGAVPLSATTPAPHLIRVLRQATEPRRRRNAQENLDLIRAVSRPLRAP